MDAFIRSPDQQLSYVQQLDETTNLLSQASLSPISTDSEENDASLLSFVEADDDDSRSHDEGKLNSSNVSVCSSGSMREEEIQRTREELGATSSAFIEHLRGAAFRRKMNLAKVRDSLATKERQQRELIANREREKHAQTVATVKECEEGEFKSLQVPVSNGWKGTGGLSGVPKVDKRPPTIPQSPPLGKRQKAGLPPHMLHNSGTTGVPKVEKRSTTVPVSPQLGLRRNRTLLLPNAQARDDTETGEHVLKARSLLHKSGATGVPKVKKRSTTVPVSPQLGLRRSRTLLLPNSELRDDAEPDERVFRARPLPNWVANVRRGPHVGQNGVPKVKKRPTTVPQSPLLGARRPLSQRKIQTVSRSDPVRLPKQGIYGISPMAVYGFNENCQNRQQPLGPGFVPRSTARAEQRGTFEIVKAKMEIQRREAARRDRKRKIRKVKKELEVLRIVI